MYNWVNPIFKINPNRNFPFRQMTGIDFWMFPNKWFLDIQWKESSLSDLSDRRPKKNKHFFFNFTKISRFEFFFLQLLNLQRQAFLSCKEIFKKLQNYFFNFKFENAELMKSPSKLGKSYLDNIFWRINQNKKLIILNNKISNNKIVIMKEFSVGVIEWIVFHLCITYLAWTSLLLVSIM